MGTAGPSYIAKVARARKHLADLDVEIDRFIATRPYAVSERVEGKKMVRRLAMTSDPANTDIPVIAADAIYNLRASLDHIMSCIVVSSKRGSSMYPVYFQGVWEDPVPGENKQRAKDRARWASDTRGLVPDVLTFLKESQPPDDGGHDQGDIHVIRAINRLSNRDRHEKLPVVASGLRDISLTWTMPDGSTGSTEGQRTGNTFLKDGSKLPIPSSAVDVTIDGTPNIAVRIRQDGLHIGLPSSLYSAAAVIEDTVIPQLAQYVRR
jgi:hypothetical protein